MTPRSPAVQIALVAGTAVAVRLWLILAFPIVFGGDSMVRLLHRDRILLAHQLPLLQLFLYLLTRASADLFLIRLFMTAIGALAAIAFYLLAADLVDRRAAFWAALLFATNPYITPISTVPYQEILMLAGLMFAWHFFFAEEWLLSGICLGLACLTRFEAWAACPVLAFAYARRRRFAPGPLLKAAIVFGWAPLAWIVFRRGLAQEGSYVLDRSFTFWRLERLAYLGWITATNTAIPALLLAAAGAAAMLTRGAWRDRRLWIIGAFLALFSGALLFSAHGLMPDPATRVTSREAHIPIMAVTLLAAFAFPRYRRASLALGVLGVLLGIYGSFRWIAHETSRPEIRLGSELARYLDRHVRPQECVLVLASRALVSASLQMYLDKARETGGEEGLRAAIAISSENLSPIDYQRTLVHSRLGPDRLKPYPESPSGPLPAANWIAVWNDFVPADDRSAEWARLAVSHPAAVLRRGDRSVAVYRFADAEPRP
ncbi:MAG: glycosyltransferase family 39 protein [Acidobacteriia bacterium]|nr:glycosyltransferase family 39 protein [Terriglobia bacterium]